MGCSAAELSRHKRVPVALLGTELLGGSSIVHAGGVGRRVLLVPLALSLPLGCH